MRQKLREFGEIWDFRQARKPQAQAAFDIEDGSTSHAEYGFSEFDGDAWMRLLAEQKLVIAHAAGVDPSHVTIRIGH